MVKRRYNNRTSYKSKRKAGINLSTPFIAGLAVGFTDIDKQVPAELVLGAAVAPVSGIGSIKAVAQGVIFGNLIQKFMKTRQLSGTTAGGMI